MTIPLATHLVPLKFALALFVLADLSCALRIGFENPRKALRDEWVRLAPMIAVGTALGVTLLVNLPRGTAMLRATMGFATLTSISLRATAFLLTGLLLDPDVWWAALAVVPAALLGISAARQRDAERTDRIPGADHPDGNGLGAADGIVLPELRRPGLVRVLFHCGTARWLKPNR